MASSRLHKFLDTHSTEKYFMEYGGFLSNHLAHGLIALDRLGATSDRLDKFIEVYTKKLEGPASSEEVATDDIDELVGKRVSFYAILKHYEQKLSDCGGNLDTLIANVFPKLSIGLAGSALHGLIHLGYGYAVQNKRTVLEGITYLHHSNMPIHTSKQGILGQGTISILDVLAAVGKDESLRNTMMSGYDKEEYTALKVGRFQRKVGCLLNEEGDKLTSYMLSIQIPESTVGADGSIDPLQLTRTVLKWAITAYTASEKQNDFFLLHGVTAAWSLLQLVPDLSPSDAVQAVQHYLVVLMAVYIAQNAPPLTLTITPRTVTAQDWETLMKATIEEERDEHAYKLVQVCYDMVQSDPDSAPLYFQASEAAIKSDPII